MKKRILAMLCAATATGAVLAVPTTAQAADPHAWGFEAQVEQENVVLYFKTLEQPKGLKVHLRKKGTAARVATITTFSTRDQCHLGCDIGEVTSRYFLTGPLKLAALGEYAVDVEYEGTEGEAVLRKDAAALNYRLRPVFENLRTSNGVSLARRDTVLSGDLKIHDPRNGSRKPYAGGAITPSGVVATPFKADVQGHFKSRITFSGNEDVRPRVEGGIDLANIDLATELNGVKEQRSVQVAVASAEARITLDSPELTGAYAMRGKVGGAVTWKAADGTWKPAPAGSSVWGESVGTVTDDAGRFALSPQFHGDGTWSVREYSGWLTAAPQEVKVDTTSGTHLWNLAATVDANKTVRVEAVFDRFEIPAGITSLKVEIQHSADGKTGWTTRKSVDVATQAGTNPRTYLDTTLPYPGAGHIRLLHASTKGIHGWITPTVKVARTETAIPSFNAAPEPVQKGRPLTVTGKLNQADPTWKPFAGQTVHYYFRPTGSTTWKAGGTSKTTADGTFTKTFTATATGSWTARYEQTDAAHFSTTSRIDDVIVSP
ncbi:hypothetical protein OHA37_15875 [Streptomyces sp. NBC_00335]|uniref:hypothetical protein n=1 Tax=unclassified Streptomyces TaxID=2593676 RepID=UPI00225B4B59|nr:MULTISPECIES: hypothetical protein [unclassified Streptomyces]MCX5405361.1 hypothetical protein [Streptomyces sp. NBC_00086]